MWTVHLGPRTEGGRLLSNNHSHTRAGRLQPRDPCMHEVASDATWGALPLVYRFPLGSVVSVSAQQAPRPPRSPFDSAIAEPEGPRLGLQGVLLSVLLAPWPSVLSPSTPPPHPRTCPEAQET